MSIEVLSIKFRCDTVKYLPRDQQAGLEEAYSCRIDEVLGNVEIDLDVGQSVTDCLQYRVPDLVGDIKFAVEKAWNRSDLLL